MVPSQKKAGKKSIDQCSRVKISTALAVGAYRASIASTRLRAYITNPRPAYLRLGLPRSLAIRYSPSHKARLYANISNTSRVVDITLWSLFSILDERRKTVDEG